MRKILWSKQISHLVSICKAQPLPLFRKHKAFSLCNHCETKFGVCLCCVGSYRQKQIDLIEAVQRRAARFIKREYNRTSSVTEMLQSLDLDLLENRRKAHRIENILFSSK